MKSFNSERAEALRIVRLVAKETNSLALLALVGIVAKELVSRAIRSAKTKLKEIGLASVIIATRMIAFK